MDYTSGASVASAAASTLHAKGHNMTSTNFHQVKKIIVSRFYKMQEMTTPTWVLSFDIDCANGEWHNVTMFIDKPEALGEFTDSIETVNAQLGGIV